MLKRADSQLDEWRTKRAESAAKKKIDRLDDPLGEPRGTSAKMAGQASDGSGDSLKVAKNGQMSRQKYGNTDVPNIYSLSSHNMNMIN